MGLCISDQLGNSVGRNIRIGNKHHVKAGDDANGHKIAKRIVGEACVQAGIDDEIAVDSDH
jgi:hypothetical protein